LPIDPEFAWRNPLTEALGHEPPATGAAHHPEYDGPRVLRPEHLACDIGKRYRADWEMLADPAP
jgi:hypothetical protein